MDSKDNVYITGYTNSFTGSWQPFLVKYNSLGQYQWNRTFGGSRGKGVAVDNLDNVYVAGSSLTKWNSSGDLQWIADWGSFNDLAVDSDYNVYVVEFSEDSNGYDEIVIAKYDSSGVRQWIVDWKGPYSQSRGRKIILDSDSNVYIAGYSQFNQFGWMNYLLLVYDNSGVLKFMDSWGTLYSDFAEGIALDSWGNVYLMGSLRYGAPFGGDKMSLVKYRNDLNLPEIIIISPETNNVFSESTINYNISITTPELNSSWYSLNGGTNYTFSGNTGIINQTAWDTCENGTIILRFYANDTLGNIGSAEVTIYKDIIEPDISITNPFQYQLFGSSAPDFDVSVNDGNLHSTWYSLNGGNNYSLTETTGTINQTVWDACENGTITLTFFANDTVGHLSSASVIIYKNLILPSIAIEIPNQNQLFGNLSPNFNVSVNDGNLHSTWYSLNGGNNYSFTETTGMINQTAWDNCFDGNVILRFYVNDSAGNLAHDEVIIIKDTTPPNITVNNPLPNSSYGGNSPSFNVLIQDHHLDLMWYTINTGIYKYIFTNNNTIDQDAWNTIQNGPVILTFYANDSLGNIGSQLINISKQAYPEISINLPLENGLFGFNAPAFNVEIYNISVDTIWYSIDDGLTNFTFSNNDTINQGAWDLQLSGLITLTFSVNSTAGDIFQESIIVEKDVDAPQISIITPIQDEVFEIPPAYEMTITEANLDKIWYTFDGGTNKIFITELIGVIDLTLWNQLPNGYVTIRFYANDTLGNISFDEVIVIKDIPTTNPPPEGIPGYNVIILLGMISLIAVFIIKRIAKEI